MPLIAAHIAGVPVEESLLMLAPLGLAGVGATLASMVRVARERAGLRGRRRGAVGGRR